MRRIYLDNAATSWPKPESVYRAVDRCLRELGAPAGRGVYAEAIEVAALVNAARRAVARIIGVRDERRIVFTSGGTESLNLAIHGLLATVEGDPPHVVTTVVEHNSVLRPLRMLENAGRISVTRVGCNSAGAVAVEDVRAAIQPNTWLIALTHASNVTGALQPAREIGQIAREADAWFLLDAAQSLGDVPIDVEALQVDLLAAPGHKGLLGPLGTGVLYIREGVDPHLAAIKQGGTGSHSERDTQPDELPDKYEPGNLNVPGIVGLLAGAEYVADRTVESIRDHARQLTAQLMDGLQTIAGVRVIAPRQSDERVGLTSITIDGYAPQELAAALESGRRIQARAGLHCAPLAHRAIGTLAGGGTLRFSPGPLNTSDDIDDALHAIAELAAASPT